MSSLKPLILKIVIVFFLLSVFFVKKVNGYLECHGSGLTTYRDYQCPYDQDNLRYECIYYDSTITTYCRWWYNQCTRPESIQWNDRCYKPNNPQYECSWDDLGHHPETRNGCWTCENSCTPQCQGSWSACSNNCGDGTQTSPRYCVAQCGNTVYGTDCSQSCCSCSQSCSCDASEPDYQNQCSAPYCGQYVCDTTYGQRCAGSSCPLACSKTNCGYCSNYRSYSLTFPSSVVHDMPISLSGFVRDNNGATDGVEDVHIYKDDTFWTNFDGNGITIKPNDPNAGSFNGNLIVPNTATLYTNTGGRNGSNHQVTLDFWAVQTETNTCGNWKFDTKTITLTNTAPSNPSVIFKDSNGNPICTNNGCAGIPLLSHTTDNILKVEIKINDPDNFPTSPAGYQRGSDIQELTFAFGDYYQVKYTDTGNNNFSVVEDGGTLVELITLQNTSQSRNYTNPTLTISFNLNFTDFPQSENFTSNVNISAKDFAGSTFSQQVIGNITFYPPYWYKLKNTSLIKMGTLTNYLASSPQPYDADDNSQRLLIIGEGGVVTTVGNNITLGGNTADLVSSKKWYALNYQNSRNFFVNQYIQYSKSRKAMKIITNTNDIETNKINLLKSGNITIDNNNKSLFEKENYVLIVRNQQDTDFAEVIFNLNSFNNATPFKSLAIIAKKITFSDNTQEINGVFLASSFQLATNPSPHYTNNPLKITGNLSSFEEIVDTTVRRRTDVTRPSIFIVFSPTMYLNLLPFLSISKYNWQQQQ